MQLQQLAEQHVAFAFECLKELRGSLDYSLNDFDQYIQTYQLTSHKDYQILIGIIDDQPVGMLTCNRFSMPRYLGFGIELEEVIIHPTFQGKGYSKQMLAIFFEQIKQDMSVRKVLVKTDDRLKAGKLYIQLCDVVETTVFGKNINYL